MPLVLFTYISIPNVNIAAAAEVEAFCNSPGQPCHKIKRIAAALAEPVASAEADPGRRPWCWLPGQYCLKKKRDAAANASPWCRFPGQYCLKNKRDAAANALPWCRLPGQACSHAKRQLDELEVVLKAM